MKNQFILLGCALLALSACSSRSGGAGGRDGRLTSQQREHYLPAIGDPGSVAAADVAFSLAAREDGQWTAFRQFAAPNAVIHGSDGVIEAGPWLASRTDPPAAVSWTPTAVWSSCDGSVAVSFGRFRDADGLVGSYTTVWQLQRNGDYLWAYDLAAQDNPQPPAPEPELEPDEDTIVVTELSSIDGRVADCARDGLPPVPAPLPAAATSNGAAATSLDATLQWRWEHGADGTRRVVVDYLRNGAWQQAMELTASVPAPAGE